MRAQPPDEATTALATELYPLMEVAVAATRAAVWHPGDSLESLLAPAVVAIAVKAGKAAGPHADHIRAETLAAFDGFTITWDHDLISLWCTRCADDDPNPVELFAGNPTDMAEIVAAITAHAAHHGKESGA